MTANVRAFLGGSGEGVNVVQPFTTVPGDRVLVAIVGSDRAKTWSNIKFNGVSLTSRVGYSTFVELFDLDNPGIGAYNFTATVSGQYFWYIVMALKGTLLASPRGNSGNDSGAGTSCTHNVPTAAAHLVIDGMSAMGGVGANNPGAGQTEMYDAAFGLSSWELATGATTTMSWSWTTSRTFYHVSQAYKSSPSGQIIMVMAERWKGLLRDLKAGLVPPDVLRRRYRDLVTI